MTGRKRKGEIDVCVCSARSLSTAHTAVWMARRPQYISQTWCASLLCCSWIGCSQTNTIILTMTSDIMSSLPKKELGATVQANGIWWETYVPHLFLRELYFIALAVNTASICPFCRLCIFTQSGKNKKIDRGRWGKSIDMIAVWLSKWKVGGSITLGETLNLKSPLMAVLDARMSLKDVW